ncbi:MAG TPA: hypothetical protein DHU55_16240 [Blastocatellia bacterium]|nr:hypothetical protein [Blastocatellia bacterium]
MHTKILAACLILISSALAYGFQANQEWIKFTSPEGRFSVSLPHEPKLETISDPETKNLVNYRYTDLETGYAFICEYFDIPNPRPDLDESLNVTRDGIVRGAGATLVREEKISLYGYPGRELDLSLTVNSGTIMSARTRIYIVGSRVYSLTYVRVKDMDSTLAADIATKFFSSFKVTPNK